MLGIVFRLLLVFLVLRALIVPANAERTRHDDPQGSVCDAPLPSVCVGHKSQDPQLDLEQVAQANLPKACAPRLVERPVGEISARPSGSRPGYRPDPRTYLRRRSLPPASDSEDAA